MKELVARYFELCGRALRSLAWSTAALGRLVGRSSLAAARSRTVRVGGAALLAILRVATYAALLCGLVLGAGWLGFQRVPPSQIGVRARNFSEGGIDARDYAMGLYFSVRGLDDWHFVDASTQMLAFGWESEGGEHPALEVRVRDGNLANVGLSIPYRVKRGEAHRIVADGLRTAYRDRVRATVEKLASIDLAAFRSEDLMSTETRAAWCEAILPRINAELAPLHVEAESVLVTQVFFGVEYEKKLQQKQLARQSGLLEASRTEVERQRGKNQTAEQEIGLAENTIRAAADARIAARYAEGRAKIVALESEARDYDRRRRAEAQAQADRLVAEGELALAKVESLQAELEVALHEGESGRLLLAKQAAENLNLKSVVLNSNDPRVPNVLDLEALVELLVGPKDD